jgi:hypothetical protein
MIHQSVIVELNKKMPPMCDTVSYCCPKSAVRKTPNKTLSLAQRRARDYDSERERERERERDRERAGERERERDELHH